MCSSDLCTDIEHGCGGNVAHQCADNRFPRPVEWLIRLAREDPVARRYSPQQQLALSALDGLLAEAAPAEIGFLAGVIDLCPRPGQESLPAPLHC